MTTTRLLALTTAVCLPAMAAAQDAERPYTYDPGDHASAEEHYNALYDAGGKPPDAPGLGGPARLVRPLDP